MAGRNRLWISGVVALVTAVVLVVFAPFLISKGIRTWLWWKTHGTNVTVKVDAIEAPFLHPIMLRGVRVQTSPAAAVQVNASAARVVFGLNLKSILLRTRGRTLTNLSVHGVHVEVRRSKTGTEFSEDGWNTIQRLLPEK